MIQTYNIKYTQTTQPLLSYNDHERLFQAIQDYGKPSIGTDNPPDPIRVVQMFLLLRQVRDLSRGDYIELGTLTGMTLRIIHQFMAEGCTLYSLDTFEGFNADDLAAETAKGPYTLEVSKAAGKINGFWPTSVEKVRTYLNDPPNLEVIQGWFPDSYEGLEDKWWRFVHIDMDLYQPTLRALQTLWPQVVPGGIVLIHDYGQNTFAVRPAVDEFCESMNLYPVTLPDLHGSIVLRKQGS